VVAVLLACRCRRPSCAAGAAGARASQARGNTPAKDSPARELGLGRIGVGFGCRRFAAGDRAFSRRLFLRLPFALCWSGVFVFFPVTGFWGQDWDSFGVALIPLLKIHVYGADQS
jgi:hypothetical protein